VFYQFREACRGISEACLALETPVTGGNVSFYNESPTGSIDPTPIIGMVGVLDDVARAVGSHFQQPGDVIVLLGTTRGHVGASSYWAHVLDTIAGDAPPVDLAAERKLIDLLVAAAGKQFLSSAHDLSDGGLAVALAEACIGGPYADGPFGAKVDLTGVQGTLSQESVFFGEDHGRALVSVAPRQRDSLLALAQSLGVPAAAIGTVGEKQAKLEAVFRDGTIKVASGELRGIYYDAIPRRMNVIANQDAAD
jgi:phosphoribosylformylglycinamidine synthase